MHKRLANRYRNIAKCHKITVNFNDINQKMNVKQSTKYNRIQIK